MRLLALLRRGLWIGPFVLVPHLASADAELDGKWIASWASNRGARLEAQVIVAGNAGSWKELRTVREDPCASVEAPLQVTQAGSDEIVFLSKYSEIIAGCADQRVVVRRVSPSSFEGTFASGRKITLTKQ